MTGAGPYTVACLQTHPCFGDVAGNLARQRELLETAVGAGARLLVLPECCSTGYCFEDEREALSFSEELGRGPASELWLELAARHDVHIVAGVVERAGGAVYNSAALVGPDGVVGAYRKAHLWNREKEIFAAGDLGFPVYDTPLGRIGMHICYDAWFPEAFRLPALAGADIVCAPCNWVPVPGQPADQAVMASMLCMTGAHSNLLYVAAADRVGEERGQRFLGRSIVVDYGGWPLAGPAGADGEAIVYADIDPIGSRELRASNPFNQPLGDRRTDLYADLLGSTTKEQLA
jgi:N-carbamoylputrescine amidase